MTIGTIHNWHGETIDYTLATGQGSNPRDDLVVIGHGVTANKDRPWAQTLATTLEQAEYTTLRISFSGNGASEGRFEDSTITKEVADLGAVLDAIGGDPVLANRPICYVGHSMGAAVGVLCASRDSRISRLVSLGGMVHTADFVQRKFGDLTPGVDVMWDRQDCPLSQSFVDDLRGIDSVREAATAVSVPFLLVHGADDTVVPVRDSEDVLAARLTAGSQPNAKLVVIGDADHVFTGGAATEMAAEVEHWLGHG